MSSDQEVDIQFSVRPEPFQPLWLSERKDDHQPQAYYESQGNRATEYRKGPDMHLSKNDEKKLFLNMTLQ
jgi:hypothetical protein